MNKFCNFILFNNNFSKKNIKQGEYQNSLNRMTLLLNRMNIKINIKY